MHLAYKNGEKLFVGLDESQISEEEDNTELNASEVAREITDWHSARY
jgi:hypothetical protein